MDKKKKMNKMDSCSLLPDFLLSARRQRAADFLWSDTGRWLCGPGPQSGPWGALQTGEQLDGEGRTLAVSRVVAWKEGGIEKKQHHNVKGISGRDKNTPPQSDQNGSACGELPCSNIQSMKVYMHIYTFSESIV